MHLIIFIFLLVLLAGGKDSVFYLCSICRNFAELFSDDSFFLKRENDFLKSL